MSGTACLDQRLGPPAEMKPLVPRSLLPASQNQLEHKPPQLSQPDLILPDEILLHIFQDAFALRNADLETQEERSMRSVSSSEFSPEPFDDWKVLSLICSCKLFASIAIPELYRTANLTSYDSLLNWLDFPRRESLASVKTIDLRFIRRDRDNVSFSTNRVIRSQDLPYGTCGGRDSFVLLLPPIDLTSPSMPVEGTWKRAHLPNMTTVKISQDAWDQGTIPPMTLFDPTTLTIYGATLDRDVSDLFDQGGSSFLDRLVLHCDLSGHLEIVKSVRRHRIDAWLWGHDDAFPYHWGASRWKADLTLTVGWRRVPASGIAWPIRAHYLVALEHIAPVLIESLEPREITISPYLEDGNHDFCFPTRPPRDFDVRRRGIYHHPLSRIVFRSNCECHHGDVTHLWDNFSEVLIGKLQVRPLILLDDFLDDVSNMT